MQRPPTPSPSRYPATLTIPILMTTWLLLCGPTDSCLPPRQPIVTPFTWPQILGRRIAIRCRVWIRKASSTIFV